MKISLLNERILIQRHVITQDEIGNQMNEWLDYFSCFATISGESPKDINQDSFVRDDSAISFIIRYSKETELVNSTQYRIMFRDTIYQIEGVDHMNYKKKLLKLHCRRVAR